MSIVDISYTQVTAFVRMCNEELEKYTKYPSGSEWRRWDLHIHAPGTIFNDQFTGSTTDEKWELFLSEVEKHEDVAVLGVTDYYSIRCYERAREHWDEGRMSNIKFLLPNIEFRTIPVTRDGKGINLHLLVNPTIIPQLNTQLFGKLTFPYNENTYTCQAFDLIQLGRDYRNDPSLPEEQAFHDGAQQFKINPDQLQRVLQSSKILRDNILVGCPNSSKDGASGVRHSSFTAMRNQIYRSVDFIFSARQGDINFFLGRGTKPVDEIIQTFGSLKPCIHGSDAHSNDKILKPDLDRYTWIKADPTFEGLRQVLAEPEARVRIQRNRPEDKNAYQVINRVRFSHADGIFSDDWIDLNPNLNSIIGGKSSGKSMLLYHIARTLDPKRIVELNAHNQESQRQAIGYKLEEEEGFDFQVEWQDGRLQTLKGAADGDQHRPITYIPQLHLIRLAEDKEEELYSLIERTLLDSSPEYKRERDLLNAQIQETANKLNRAIDEYLTTFADLETKHEERRQLGDKEAVAAAIAGIDSQIQTLRRESELTHEEERNHQELLETISELNTKKDKLNAQRTSLTRARKKFLDLADRLKNETGSDIVKAVVSELPDMNEAHRSELDGIATRIGNRLALEARNAAEEEFAVIEMIQNQEDETAVQLSEANSRIQPFQGKIKNQELLADLQKQRKKEFAKQQQMEKLDGEIWALQSTMSLDTIFEHYARRFELYIQIVKVTGEYGTIFDDLEVHASIKHNDTSFQSNLLEQINKQRSLESQFEIAAFSDNVFTFEPEHHVQYIKAMANSLIDNQIGFRKNFDRESALRALLEDYVLVRYNVSQDGDDIWEMSPGKRGIVLFQLFLHLDNSRDPILIDQPEDNLDNRTIYEELNQFIRTKKLDRQIIIVTHNANLVVSTDSENVIVANQDPTYSKDNAQYRFEYVTGSLEHTQSRDDRQGILYRQSIREHVCEILEGGIEAFEKREQKYGISRLRE